MKSLKGTNGVHYYDPLTQVAIRDSRGVVHVYAKNERSGGTVNTRLYSSYGSKRYDEGRRKPKVEKPFVAQVTPIELDLNRGFKPFVVHKK